MIVRAVLSALRRRWWILVACLVLGGIASGATALMQKPTYTSNAHLLVATPNIDQSAQVPPGGITTQQRAVNYAAMVTGSTIVDQVISELGLTQTAPVLVQNTHVTVMSGTTIIQIAVEDTDPAQAQRIAHAYAAALVATVPKVEKASGVTNSPATITLTDDADLPQLPTSTSRSSIVELGVIGGIIVGALLIWVLEYLDTHLRDPRKLAATSGYPVLGTIVDDPDSTGNLITSSPVHGPHVESYRSLRTALQFLDIEGSSPVFAVVGASPGTGTSTAAANIAISMAQAGQRTMLIDADLHRPRLAELLGLTAPGAGLSGVLSGTAAVAQETVRWEPGGIDVLPAGAPPTLPTELVQSKSMDDLLAKLRDRYDVIVLDTPPLNEFTDGALLTAAADGAILITRFGDTRAEDVTTAIARLSMVRARVLGSVLVGAPARADSGTVLPAPEPA